MNLRIIKVPNANLYQPLHIQRGSFAWKNHAIALSRIGTPFRLEGFDWQFDGDFCKEIEKCSNMLFCMNVEMSTAFFLKKLKTRN